MLQDGFVHPSINCEDVHPEIAPFAAAIPHALRPLPDLRVLAKAGFGFGDVNACVVFGKMGPLTGGRAVNRRKERAMSEMEVMRDGGRASSPPT